MAGYVRQSTADIIPTATVRAAPINAEYNALRDAFAASGGHKHDGTSGEGEYVPLIADLDALNKVVIDTTNNRVGVFVEVSAAAVEQIRIQDGVIVPVTDNDIDLGTSSVEFKDLYLDGTAYIDTLAVHESATITSNFSVNGNTTLGNAASDTVTFTADIASAMLPSADNTHDLGAVGSEWRNLYIDGTANIDALIADTATISAGTIDNTVIGGSTAVAGSFSTISSSGATTLASLTVSGATALNGGLTLDTNKFTVADTTGNTAIAGTLDVTGATTVADFTATGTTVLPATSFGDNNITNVGNIALDSITADGSSITITGNTTFADGAYDFDVASHDGSNGLKLAGTLVTSSAAELNKLDGATVTTTEINILDGDNSATSTTVADADRVVMNDNGTMVQVAVTDLAAYFDDEITAMPNLVTTAATTVGALNSGSITSGFGSIDTGSSTITTTGNITGGNVIISDGGNIGSASDTDAIAIASNGNVTLSQNLTVSGDLQVDGTTTTVNSNNLSVDDQLIELGNGRTGSATGDSGIVIERGSDANAFIGFDESADKFTVGTGTFTGTSTGDLSITTGTLVANIEGNVTGDLTGNADTATALETARTIAGQSFDGTANISIATTDLTSVTATAAEVNIMDGDTAASSTTLADADRVVVNDAGTMKQVALTDFETYFESALDTLSNVTTVGTLNSGSITSGFGSIDNGSSAITTTGTITFGTLSDGSDSVTDIVTSVGSGSANSELPTALAVENRIQAINSISNNVSGLNATGAELNAVADVSAITIDTSTAIANNDGIAVFDSSASAIGYFDVDLLDTYFAGTTKTLTNKTLTSPTVSGLYLSDAGFIVEGSSADGNESTVTFTNPTADRTITFPDATGTVALSGATQNVDFGTVTADGLTVDGTTTLRTSDSSVELTVESTDTTAAQGAKIILTHNKTAANGDVAGYIDFKANNDGASEHLFGRIQVDATDVSAGSEDGRLRLSTLVNGSTFEAMRITTGTVFNEGGIDADFRVESDSNTHALFVDAGNNRVGINDSAPSHALDVTSTDQVAVGFTGSHSGVSYFKYTNSATSAVGVGSAIEFRANTSTTERQVGFIQAAWTDNTDATRESSMRLFNNKGGSNRSWVDAGPDEVVINEGGADVDFRVESDTQTSAFFVEGGGKFITFGSSAQDATLGQTTVVQINGTNSTGDGSELLLHNAGQGSAARSILSFGAKNGGVEGYAAQIYTTNNDGLHFNTNASVASGFVEGTTRLRIGPTGGIQQYADAGQAVAFNEDGADVDFRVESDANANMLYVDASANSMGIGTAPDNTMILHVKDSAAGTMTKFESTDAGSAHGPTIELLRNSSSPADGDEIGRINFNAKDSTGTTTVYTQIENLIGDVTNGTEDGTMAFNTIAAGSLRPRLTLRASEAIFNENSFDTDFRVESDSNTHMLFVDAGNNVVGVNTSENQSAFALNVLGTGVSGGRAAKVQGPDVNTSTSTSAPQLVINNSNSTTGNFSSLAFASSSGGTTVFIGAKNTNHGTNSGDLYIATRGPNNGYLNKVAIRDSDMIINDSGVNYDFRIESDSNTHMLFLDASANKIGIGSSSFNYGTALTVHANDDGGTPSSVFLRNSGTSGGSGARLECGYVTGYGAAIRFSGNPSSYRMYGTYFERITGDGPTYATSGEFGTTGIFKTYEGVVHNENGNDRDFVVESDGNANMLTVDAGNNLVSFGKFGGGSTAYGGYFSASGSGFFHQVLTNTTASSTQANLFINRQGSEGQHIQLRVGDVTKGLIGTETDSNSQTLYLGFGDTGLAFQAKTDNAITPMDTNTGVARDNAIDLGASGARFDDIYATNGTIQTSDRNEKQDIAELSEAEQRVAVAAKSLMRKYRWKDAVAKKGDDARTHFGIIAQDLQAAFEAEGLDAHDYAMFTSNTEWKKEIEKSVVVGQDDDGNTITEMQMVMVGYNEPTEGATEHTRLGVRYPELFAFIISAI